MSEQPKPEGTAGGLYDAIQDAAIAYIESHSIDVYSATGAIQLFAHHQIENAAQCGFKKIEPEASK